MKLAILGSASGVASAKNEKLCKKLGKYLAQNKITVVTGGSHGIPGLVVKSAFEAGAETEVYSPDENELKHLLRSDNLSLKYFKKNILSVMFLNWCQHLKRSVIKNYL